MREKKGRKKKKEKQNKTGIAQKGEKLNIPTDGNEFLQNLTQRKRGLYFRR